MQNRYQTINIEYPANAAISSQSEEFTFDPGYSRITGVSVINTGNHTQFNVGINDNDNNIKVDPIAHEFFAQNSADGRMLAVDIPLEGAKLINVRTGIRAVNASEALKYQLIIRLEK